MSKDTGFKQVNIAARDWAIYNTMAMQLSVERGKRISIPALLKEAVDNLNVNSVDSITK